MQSPVQILIVEDSISLLRLYTTVLTQAGYSVLTADSGAAAQALLATHHPEVVLLDRVLPDTDGSELCAWIKASPDFATTYVIMLSALKTSEDDRVAGLEAGADDYIVKPVGKRELLARIKIAARLCTTQNALAASVAQFRTLAENSPDVILRLDPTGLPIYVNPGIERILGVAPDMLLRTSRSDLGIPDTLTKLWFAECQAVVAGGQQRRVEFALPTPTQTHYLDARLVPEFDASGQVTSILAVLRDFSDHVRAEQAIARLATVVEQAVEAVIITDPEGNIQFVNAAFEQLTGHTGQQLVGRNLRDTARGSEGFCHQFLGAIAGRNHWEGISHLHRTDGTRCEIEASVFPINDAQHGVINYVALLRDLTERRRTEREREVIETVAAALRRASTREEMIPVILDQISVLFNASAAAFTVVDAHSSDLVVELARGAFEGSTGLRLPALHTPTVQLLAQGQPCVITDPVALANLGWTGENPGVDTLLGVPLIAHNRGIGVLWVGSNGSFSRQTQSLLIAIADISANALHRVALYQELERYAAELEVRVAERTRELESANAQLLVLDRLKSKFVSNVSHELRTPISNLKLYMSLLYRGKPERRPHYENMLQQSTERLGQLVEDILNLSRLEIAHYQPRETELTDLNALISQIVSHHQPQADAAGLTLSFAPDSTLPLVDGDYNQLSQLVTNLLVNSLNYTRRGSVHVSTEWLRNQDRMELRIQDTGVGILPEDIPYLFERFYRGNHRQADEIPGTGLGLTIVREIVDIHHGEITLSSRVDAGSCFRVLLPIAQSERAKSSSRTIPVGVALAESEVAVNGYIS